VVSWGPNRLDIFVTATDGNIYIKSWTGTGWVPSQLDWNPMGSPIADGKVLGPPKVVSWGPGRLDIFVRGADGQLYIKSWTGSAWVPSQLGWNPPGSPNGVVAQEPAVVSWASNRLDIFATGTDNNLYIKSWTGTEWVPSQLGWASLADVAPGLPSGDVSIAVGGRVAPDAVEMIPFFRTRRCTTSLC